MVFSSVVGLLRKTNLNLQVNFIRHGHQMSTRNKCHGPKPKYRGIKRKTNEDVHTGEILVGITWNKNLYAMSEGKVKFTSEVFDANFDHPLTVAQFGNRQGQKMWKKYIHVIPSNDENRFKLVDVI